MLGSGTILFSRSNEGPKSEEYLLLGSANRGAGEPIVFVNPKDPDNIIVVAMATLNRLPSGEAPFPRGPTPGGGRNAAGVQLRIKELVGFPVPRLAGLMASFSGVSSSGAKNTPETFFELKWAGGTAIRRLRGHVQSPPEIFPTAGHGDGLLGLGHTADRLENLDPAQFGDKEPESVSLEGTRADIAARSCAVLDQTRELEFPEGAVDGDTRGYIGLHQFVLGGKPLAEGILSEAIDSFSSSRILYLGVLPPEVRAN